MKYLSNFYQIFALGLIVGGILFVSSAFSPDQDGPKPFIVSGLKQGDIDNKTKMKLRDAYQAQFKMNLNFEEIKVTREGGNAWLWFVGQEKGAPTFAIELREQRGNLVIIFNEPLGINNCITDESCSKCKVGCGCGRDGGSGSCTEVKTDKIIGEAFRMIKETLTGR